MDVLESKHIKAILRAKELRPFVEGIDQIKIKNNNINKLTDEEINEIYDECMDIWLNESPVVYERNNQGDFGSYPVQVLGVRGAYFCWAPEFDREGPFTSKKEAIGKTGFYYG